MFSIPGPWVSKTWSSPVFNTPYIYSHIRIELNGFPVHQSFAVSCKTGTSKPNVPHASRRSSLLKYFHVDVQGKGVSQLKKAHLHTPWLLLHCPSTQLQARGEVQMPPGSLLFTFRVRTVQVCFDAEKPQWIVEKKNGASSRSRTQSYLTNLTLQNAPATHMLGPLLSASL